MSRRNSKVDCLLLFFLSWPTVFPFMGIAKILLSLGLLSHKMRVNFWHHVSKSFCLYFQCFLGGGGFWIRGCWT